jgi:cysteine desulfurase family protein (TIGR01976 family)
MDCEPRHPGAMSQPAATSLDLPALRRRFPALAGDWVLFDNAGGSQILGTAVERMRHYLVTTNVQHGGGYALSQQAMERVAEGVAAAALLLGTPDPREVVLGPSATQLLQNLARAMTGTLLRRGDEILVSELEHETNVGPWLRLGDEGIRARTWHAEPETRQLTLAGLERAFSRRTRLVCLTHCSNVLGALVPVEALARFAHERGARVLVDGVAYAPHRLVDVRGWDVDFYVVSLYKTYGPHQAALYGKAEHLLELGKVNHDFVADDDIPYKLQPGGVSYEATAALPAIPEYLLERVPGVKDWIDAGADSPEPVHGPAPWHLRRRGLASAFEAFAGHEEILAERLLAYLRQKEAVTVVGPPSADRHRRVPTVSFTVEGRRPEEIVEPLGAEKIAVRHGHFYAPRLIEALGLAEHGGVVRVSMVHYNTVAEVDRLIEVLETLL